MFHDCTYISLITGINLVGLHLFSMSYPIYLIKRKFLSNLYIFGWNFRGGYRISETGGGGPNFGTHVPKVHVAIIKVTYSLALVSVGREQ